MELWNFSDYKFLTTFVVIILTIVFIILITLLFILLNYRNRKFVSQVNYESTTIKVFVLDVKKNEIVSFYKSDLRKKHKIDIVSFYGQFHPNDVDKVKEWIFQITVGDSKVDEFLEADVLIKRNRKPCFSLLRLLKFDSETGIIHIESHLLKYITPNNVNRSKAYKKKVPTGVLKKSQIYSLIKKNKSLRGFTFGIRFFYTKQKALSNNNIERHMLMTLKNEVYPFACGKKIQRQILDDGDNEIYLFDLHMGDSKEAFSFCTSIAHSIRKQIEVNGFSGYISFTIAIVENRQYYQDLDKILEICNDTCILGQTNEQEIIVHERSIDNSSNTDKYKNQVDHLFDKDAIRYLFRPIIDITKTQTIGYFQFVKAYDSAFSNFQEMVKYSAKIGLNTDLFALICKHVIPKFAAENQFNDCKLFLNVSLLDADKIDGTIKQIPSSSNTKIVLVFDEHEINENSSDYNVLSAVLMNLINSGYQISLYLRDKDLLLDNQIYTLFDYFIVGSSMLSEIRRNNRIRLSAYTLIESLLKYNRPIIASGLESWQAIELIVESGITILSSDVISPENDMLLPIEKKKMEKLNGMKDKYL